MIKFSQSRSSRHEAELQPPTTLTGKRSSPQQNTSQCWRNARAFGDFFCDKWFFHIGDGVESCRRPRTSSRYRRFFFLRYISYSSTTVLNVKLSANSNMPVAIPNILPRLPRWISHWLGYRPTPPKPHPQYLVWLWSFFTAFCGLCVLQAIFNYSSYFLQRGVPGIVASFVSTKMFFFFLFPSSYVAISGPRFGLTAEKAGINILGERQLT